MSNFIESKLLFDYLQEVGVMPHAENNATVHTNDSHNNFTINVSRSCLGVPYHQYTKNGKEQKIPIKKLFERIDEIFDEVFACRQSQLVNVSHLYSIRALGEKMRVIAKEQQSFLTEEKKSCIGKIIALVRWLLCINTTVLAIQNAAVNKILDDEHFHSSAVWNNLRVLSNCVQKSFSNMYKNIVPPPETAQE